MRIFLVAILSLFLSSAAVAKDKPVTLQEALDQAERALDIGAMGDAASISEKLHRTRLNKDEKRRLELIDARCDLVRGDFAASEKVLGRLYKAAPADVRLGEWYARALDGSGKSDVALPLLKDLAKNKSLKDGDSYWTLAQLERKAGDNGTALLHARLALKHPIVLQSDELDKEIHKFISDLEKTKK